MSNYIVLGEVFRNTQKEQPKLMCQFDFPRINFSGRASINPCTANNNLLLPLVTYDPINAKAILPPRIYLSDDLKTLYKLGNLPISTNIKNQIERDKLEFIEIDSVNSKDKYVEWAKLPLGDSAIDSAFHALYKLVKSRRTGEPIYGGIPASWNFYGGMEFSFENVKVCGLAMFDNLFGQKIYSEKDQNLPLEIQKIIGANLEMKNNRGQSSAVMIDVLPSLAMFSQVFCDSLTLSSDKEILMKGKPKKGALRFFNPKRVLNQQGVLAASGSFFSVIPLHQLEDGESGFLYSFFKKYCKNPSKLKGVFMRYNLSEIWENQEIDYKTHGNNANPAKATLIGSLSPYFENDLTSIGMGRQFIAEKSFHGKDKIAPFVCQLSKSSNFLSMDILGSIPMIENSFGGYEIFDLGLLNIMIKGNNHELLKVGDLDISSKSPGMSEILLNSGLLEIKINPDVNRKLLNSSHLMLCRNKEILMKESPYMVASDQAGLYANANEAESGFVTDGIEREECRVQIYRHGSPLKGTVPMTIMELKIDGVGNKASVTEYLKKVKFRNNQLLELPKQNPINAMYVFYPAPMEVISKDLISEIHRTGFFISLRVLSAKDYSKYLDPEHEAYASPVTFEVLYEEVLKNYDFVFPIASIITPFTEEYFKKGAEFIKKRMSPENWKNATYMPSSRDMSHDQWLLFCKWYEDLKVV